MALCRGSGLGGGGWDIALQHFSKIHEWPNKPYQWSFLAINQFQTLISTLLDVFSQLATCQPAPRPFKEHPCARGCQTVSM